MFFNKDKKENEELWARVNELEQKIILLQNDLIHDPMTGLKTKSFFEEECGLYLSLLENQAGSNRREEFGYKNVSIIFFDIDSFKEINDTYGHQVGDTVLTQVAKTILDEFREEDTVARWGGDEFAASLLGASEDDTRRKADDIREKISRLYFEHDPKCKLTLSIGVASAGQGVKYEELLKRADRALSQAKQTGKNKVVTHSEASA